MTRERISLLLVPTRPHDPELVCIVCGRPRCDREIAYRTHDGRAYQGIHLRCVARAESLRSRRGLPSRGNADG